MLRMGGILLHLHLYVIMACARTVYLTIYVGLRVKCIFFVKYYPMSGRVDKF